MPPAASRNDWSASAFVNRTVGGKVIETLYGVIEEDYKKTERVVFVCVPIYYTKIALNAASASRSLIFY